MILLPGPPAITTALESMYDPRVGIIRWLSEMPRPAGEPDFFHFWSNGSDTTAFSDQKSFAQGGGASATRGGALAKAIGELVERYCSALFDRFDLPLTSMAQAPFACVRPDVFALGSEEQYAQPGFPLTPFREDTAVRWVSMKDLSSGEIVWVPAALVFAPYPIYEDGGEMMIAQSISTGLACHETLFDAAITATCEVIERDALTITWQGMLARPVIDAASLSISNRDLVRRFTEAGYEVTVLNITMEHGIPTILSVCRSQAEERAAFVVAGSASPEPEVAARKSLEELAHTLAYCNFLKATQPRLEIQPGNGNVVDQETHLNFWTDQANAGLGDFLTSSPAVQSFTEIEPVGRAEPEGTLRELTERVKSTGHTVLVRDLTTPDISKVGLHVCRALIPGYHPLVIEHRLRSLGGRRLWEAPQRLGYPGIIQATGDNPAPHPYP